MKGPLNQRHKPSNKIITSARQHFFNITVNYIYCSFTFMQRQEIYRFFKINGVIFSKNRSKEKARSFLNAKKGGLFADP